MKEVLIIRGLKKSYNNKEPYAINGIDLAIKQGEVCAIVGQSGCGKSTLLKLISGLEAPDRGEIILNGTVVSSEKVFLPAEKRTVGLVFQSFALFPHMTVEKNLRFGLKSNSGKEKINELLTLVGLENYENKYPHELSGGEQQRVALARALAPNPALILLDEPFSNLDTSLKQQLRDDLFSIIKRAGVSCIFVTHDIKDAMAIGDKIAVIKKGRIEQYGRPEVLYTKPVNPYVANLFEETNVLSSEELSNILPKDSDAQCFGIRSRDIALTSIHEDDVMKVKLIRQQYLGREINYLVETESGNRLSIHVHAVDAPLDHTTLGIKLPKEKILIFKRAN